MAKKSAKTKKAKKVVTKKVAVKKTTKKNVLKKVVKKTVSSKVKVRPKPASDKLLDAVIKGVEEKKAHNIVCLDLRNIENSVCDYFVICEGSSRTQVESIADSVKEEVKKMTNEKPFHSEGYENAQWVLIDYITTVVHVFQPDVRSFYNIEGLWADAEVIKIS